MPPEDLTRLLLGFSSLEKRLVGIAVHDEISLRFHNQSHYGVPATVQNEVFKRAGCDAERMYTLVAEQNIAVFEQALLDTVCSCLWDLNSALADLNERSAVRVDSPLVIRDNKLVLTVVVSAADMIWGEHCEAVDHCVRNMLNRRFGNWVTELDTDALSPSVARYEVELDQCLIMDRDHAFWFRTFLRAYIGLGLDYVGGSPTLARAGGGMSLAVISKGGPCYIRSLKIPRGRTTKTRDDGHDIVFYTERDLRRTDHQCSN